MNKQILKNKKFIPIYKPFFEDVKYDKNITSKPIESTIKYLYHGTDIPSSIFVAHNNKLAVTRRNKFKWISFSLNKRYYSYHHVPVTGTLSVIWVLDYILLKKNNIKFKINTSNLKSTDNWEIILKQKELSNFNTYVIKMFIIKESILEYYDHLLEISEHIKIYPNQFSKYTNKATPFTNLGFKHIPKDYDSFEKEYIKLMSKKFYNIKIIDRLGIKSNLGNYE